MSKTSSTTIAVLVAGGGGSRFGGDVPKQYLSLAGVPVIRRSALAFLEHPKVDGVIVVIRAGDEALAAAALTGLEIAATVTGGADRQASVLAGLEAASALAPARVLIHDAARPLVTAGMIDGVVDALAQHPGALPVLPVVDTLKRGSGPVSEGTVERAGLHRAQTPQGFRFPEILAAHRAVAGQSLTDDTAVAEAAGLTVALTPGDERALKITTAGDLAMAERLLAGPETITVTGSGFDVHAFAEGDFVTLCGLEIPHSKGLAGHSDADVGLHALTDALLGTIANGDIGAHFPPSDPRWRGADSAQFLRHAADLVTAQGGQILHCDVTLICEAPKVGPHRDAMRQRIADILGMPLARISVKATTTERLGFTGRQEGIASQAVATVRLPA
ncbi:bifunctional 2-C-methyl-D-erythritol 4-phosphate cytidylyltransferase/2-C-methyl-D-erythritol 2,4-cyclodiphosphate synthase [Lacibacterium aquatile]|uniref:Bifunctional enzyme IspD/IspF n=1 Tax=Lacibacterium aquatile TaxID=1168082 RepID=A0ABW5DR25_9PROT